MNQVTATVMLLLLTQAIIRGAVSDALMALGFIIFYFHMSVPVLFAIGWALESDSWRSVGGLVLYIALEGFNAVLHLAIQE